MIAESSWVLIVDLVLQVGIPVFLIVLGFVVGRWRERRHFRSIVRREREMADMAGTNLKRVPDGYRATGSILCTGDVVVATDAFKSFGARLKSLVGGRLRTYETLLARGRREAILRMLAQAREHGANMVLNVRLETAAIARSGSNANSPTGVEVLAYGTGVSLVPAVEAE